MTPKQKKVYDYIDSFWNNNGYGPSQDEIAKHMNFNSRSQAYAMTTNLIDQGFLKKKPGKIRSLEVCHEQVS